MFLSDNTIFQRKVLIHKAEVPSTHLYAKDIIAKSSPSQLTSIIADYQTDGIGQYGSKWHSLKGKNLNLSIIIPKLNIPADQNFYLNIISSLLCRDTIIQYVHDKHIEVKWPNDIILNGKKLGGILTHTQVVSGVVETAVISFGINISTEFPEDIPHATNLECATDQLPDPLDLEEDITRFMEYYFLQFSQGNKHSLLKHYHENLYLLGIQKEYLNNKGERFKGTIMGVNSSGKLLVNIKGRLHKFSTKEIQFLYE